MERYGNFLVYTDDEVLYEFYGPKGTPERDAFETEVERGAREFLARKAIERATKGLPLEFTEEELTCDDIEEEHELEVEMV